MNYKSMVLQSVFFTEKVQIMKELNNISVFSSYVGFQIATLSKLQITKMACKGPFSFMNFHDVTFHFTAVEKIFSTLRAFSLWFFFPFMDFLDMFIHTSLSTKLTIAFLLLMNYKSMVLQPLFYCKSSNYERIKQHFCVFLLYGFSDCHFVQTSSHKDDMQRAFFFHELP